MFFALCGSSLAQQPPRLEPLPEPPPPPPGVAIEAPGEQPIRITPGENDLIEEIVVDGQRVIKVTQPSGKIYYLQEDPANPSARDGLGNRLRVPMWVIKEF
jgi:hypothetical protein